MKVAVIDTGIDPNHPDLAGRIAGGYNAIDPKASWADDHFHGTHVAGTIAANRDGKGVVGVAPKAQLYAVKVLTKEGSGSLFGILDGINWCVRNGMKIANMSLGADQGNQFFEMAIKQVVRGGVAVIAAAGNNGAAVGFPAAYPEAIAISALCPPGVTEPKLCTSTREGIAKFSSRGPEVDFIAPGVNVVSTVTGGGLRALSGTSMATPHASGLAALAVAAGAKGPPGVRAALERMSVKLGGLSSNEQGNGLPDASRLNR